jgi:hypothetical protein
MWLAWYTIANISHGRTDQKSDNVKLRLPSPQPCRVPEMTLLTNVSATCVVHATKGGLLSLFDQYFFFTGH